MPKTTKRKWGHEWTNHDNNDEVPENDDTDELKRSIDQWMARACAFAYFFYSELLCDVVISVYRCIQKGICNMSESQRYSILLHNIY